MSLSGISDRWSEWVDCTQFRFSKGRAAFRRSTPLCMLAGLGLVLVGLVSCFTGVLPFSGVLKGLLVSACGVPVFFVGRGVDINPTMRTVRRWWGWIHKPVFGVKHDFSEFEALLITKKLGPKGGGNTGRSVRYPICLKSRDGRRVLLVSNSWIDDARELAVPIGQMLSLSVKDESGEPLGGDPRPYDPMDGSMRPPDNCSPLEQLRS